MSKGTKVAFICVGNACRSQIAEGLLRELGGKEFNVFSAGVTPLGIIPKDIYRLMEKKQIPLTGQYSKGFNKLPLKQLDILISLTGQSMLEHVSPCFSGTEIIWDISDPFRCSFTEYIKAFDTLKKNILELIWISGFNS